MVVHKGWLGEFFEGSLRGLGFIYCALYLTASLVDM